MARGGEREPGRAGDLAADTAVAAAGDGGWYQAALPEHWSFALPSGGVLTTLALRAARAELADPGLRLRSATAVFCAPVPHGPIAIRVQVLRRGRVAAQVRVALCPGTAWDAAATARDRPIAGAGLEVSATFARDREGPSVLGAEFPDVAPPERARDLLDPESEGDPRNFHRGMRFFQQFDIRLASGHRWWLPDPPDQPASGRPTRLARWFRYRRPPRDARGMLDPLAIPPIADTMPAALMQRLPHAERTAMYAPSLDLTVHFLDPGRPGWLLVSGYARRARDGYATAEVEVWSQDRELIAYATQTMILRSGRPRAR